MPRKSKEEQYFDEHKMTIRECFNECFNPKYFEEDKLFVVLLLAGYSAAEAYRLAYPSNASMQSSAVLASRRIREPQIQTLLGRVLDCADDGLLYLSPKGFKSKRRRAFWQSKRVKNIDASPLKI